MRHPPDVSFRTVDFVLYFVFFASLPTGHIDFYMFHRDLSPVIGNYINMLILYYTTFRMTVAIQESRNVSSQCERSFMNCDGNQLQAQDHDNRFPASLTSICSDTLFSKKIRKSSSQGLRYTLFVAPLQKLVKLHPIKLIPLDDILLSVIDHS